MPKIAVVSVAHIHSRDFCKTIGKLVSGKAPHVIWDENPERGAKYAAEFNCPFEPDLDKVVADRATGEILGGHVIGPHASTLIQPLIQAMATGLDAATMARGQYWIHPALTEVVENALLALDLDPDAA